MIDIFQRNQFFAIKLKDYATLGI